MNLSDSTIISRFDELFPSGKGDNDNIDIEAQVQPSTVDLRLGSRFLVLSQNLLSETRAIDPRTADPNHYFKSFFVPEGGYFEMSPGSSNLVLGETKEYVAVPNGLVAFVDGRSSFGRWGLRIHSTAGLIDTGFRGIITLEMSLDNGWPLRLYPGDRICQIRFETLDRNATRPYGDPSRKSKYMDQTETTLSLSRKDHE